MEVNFESINSLILTNFNPPFTLARYIVKMYSFLYGAPLIVVAVEVTFLKISVRVSTTEACRMRELAWVTTMSGASMISPITNYDAGMRIGEE